MNNQEKAEGIVNLYLDAFLTAKGHLADQIRELYRADYEDWKAMRQEMIQAIKEYLDTHPDTE